MSSVELLHAFTSVAHQNAQPFFELDSLWHYQCIISPRSFSSQIVANTFPDTPNPSPDHTPNSTAAHHDTFLPISTDHPHATDASPPACSQQFPHDCFNLNSFQLQHATASSSSSSHNASLHSPDSLIVHATTVPEAAPILVANSAPNSPTSEYCSISQSDRRLLKRVFYLLDENQDGKICKEELVRFFEKLGISKTERDVTSLLKSTRVKVRGQLDEDEFVRLYEAVCNSIEQLDEESNEVDIDRDLREAFRAFDKDDDGFITPLELQAVLCSLGFPQAQDLEACVKMIERVDENGDGQVDFFEFKKMLGVEEQILAVENDTLALQTAETT